MRTVLIGVLAFSGIAVATPAIAQGVYLDTPGVGVQIGPRYREREYRDYDGPRYRAYDEDRSYRYRAEGCRTIIIRRDDGSVRRIRRCD
jgi:hypothetical protein